MVFVLVLVSPSRIEWWEGLLTLVFFPLLVAVAWGQDKGWVFEKKSEPESHFMGNVKVEPIKLEDGEKERRPSLDMSKENEVRTREEVEEAIRQLGEKKEKKQGRLQ